MKQALSDKALAEQLRLLKKHQQKMSSGALSAKHDPPTPRSSMLNYSIIIAIINHLIFTVF